MESGAIIEATLPAGRSRHRLLRVLGVGFGVAVTIGGVIGMGILRTPGDVAAQLPQRSFFIGVWILGGLYALLGTISVAELGTMLPRSGGFYIFVRRALGSYAGFVVGWSDWLSTCGTTAAVAIVVGEYTTVLFPGLAGHSVSDAVVMASYCQREMRLGRSATHNGRSPNTSRRARCPSDRAAALSAARSPSSSSPWYSISGCGATTGGPCARAAPRHRSRSR